MSVPQEVTLARHAGDLDDDGHDVHPLVLPGDMPYLGTANVATFAEGASIGPYSGNAGTDLPGFAIDGDDTTKWHPNGGTGAYMVVDLGAVKAIDAWRIVLSTVANEIPTAYVLAWSTTSTGTFTTVDTVTGGAGGDKGLREFALTSARYWRIAQTGTVPWDAAVYTLELYGAGTVEATPSDAYGRSLLDTADAAAARTLLGVSTGGGTASSITFTPTGTIAATDVQAAIAEVATDAAAALAAHVAAGGGGGTLLISDTPSTPLVFADLIQTEAQDDLVYSDT
jgi:hypothetical protein